LRYEHGTHWEKIGYYIMNYKSLNAISEEEEDENYINKIITLYYILTSLKIQRYQSLFVQLSKIFRIKKVNKLKTKKS